MSSEERELQQEQEISSLREQLAQRDALIKQMHTLLGALQATLLGHPVSPSFQTT